MISLADLKYFNIHHTLSLWTAVGPQHLLDVEPIRKQSDHRLLFGSPWAAVWLRADEFEELGRAWEGGAMGKFGRRGGAGAGAGAGAGFSRCVRA